MSTNRAYLIIPKLIEQPTWGGRYIMKEKGWQKHPDAQRKIGQSYELYSGSYLSLATDTADAAFQPELDSIPRDAFQIEQIRAEDAEGLLGTRGIKKYNGQLKTLIKFTQAKGNSFQLHVRQPDGTWLPKPESWYFFEKGLATLGITDKKKINEYKKVCKDIEDYMKSLSARIIETGHAPSLSLHEARQLAQMYIKKKNIYQFVNRVTIPKNSIVDLQYGAIHHSWEEDNELIPRGNIVYEVQVDVADDVSTLRSFDKGKIQDNGSIRPLQIDEYFKHLDTTKSMNDPAILIKKAQESVSSEFLSISPLFNTSYYKLDKLSFSQELTHEYTKTKHETFHHIFVLKGCIDYHDNSIDLTIDEGHSVFIPARVGGYVLKTNSKSATVLKTYV